MSQKSQKAEVELFDYIDDETIRKICDDLADRQQFQALSHLIQTNKRVRNACQNILTQQKRARFIHYPTFLNDIFDDSDPDYDSNQQYQDLIYDLINGDYDSWLARYPDHYVSLFGEILFYGHMKFDTVEQFVELGVDLNIASNVYTYQASDDHDRNAGTPLTLSCYLKKYHYVDALCELGADVNLRDRKGLSPLEALLTYKKLKAYTITDIEKCLRILNEYHVINRINRQLLEKIKQDLPQIAEKSPYVAEFLGKTVSGS